MLKQIIIALSLILTLSACLTDEQRLQALEKDGTIPKLDRSKDLAGPDKNNNGIRDDIEAYINKTYPEPSEKAAVMQYAKAIQKKLSVDTTDSLAVRAVVHEGGRGLYCLGERLDDPSEYISRASVVYKEIVAMTTNTKPRLLAYLAFDKALDGWVISAPTGEVCDE